jgi:hypothetical protein
LVWVRGLVDQVAVTVKQAPFDTGCPEVNNQPNGFSLFSAAFEFIFFSGIVG